MPARAPGVRWANGSFQGEPDRNNAMKFSSDLVVKTTWFGTLSLDRLDGAEQLCQALHFAHARNFSRLRRSDCPTPLTPPAAPWALEMPTSALVAFAGEASARPGAAKERKVAARGTSCVECFRRKVRCLWPNDESNTCTACARRGDVCERQDSTLVGYAVKLSSHHGS